MLNEKLELSRNIIDETTGIKAKVVRVSKNGFDCWGLTPQNNSPLSPIVYYNGEPIDIFTKKAEEVFQKARANLDVNVFRNKDYILEHSKVCVQRKTNESILKRSCLNLEVYLRLDLTTSMTSDGYMKATKSTEELLSQAGLAEKDVWAAALKNTYKSLIITSLEEIMGLVNDAPHLFDIVTTDNKMHGAAALAFRDVFRSYCCERGLEACLMLPSSIHELLLLDPNHAPDDPGDLAEMVRSVNDAEVSMFEQLDPVVYKYDLASNQITIVAEK